MNPIDTDVNIAHTEISYQTTKIISFYTFSGRRDEELRFDDTYVRLSDRLHRSDTEHLSERLKNLNLRNHTSTDCLIFDQPSPLLSDFCFRSLINRK